MENGLFDVINLPGSFLSVSNLWVIILFLHNKCLFMVMCLWHNILFPDSNKSGSKMYNLYYFHVSWSIGQAQFKPCKMHITVTDSH